MSANPNPVLIKGYLKNLLKSLDEKSSTPAPGRDHAAAMAKLLAEGKTEAEATQYLKNTPEPLW
jgi:hypothetical protein